VDRYSRRRGSDARYGLGIVSLVGFLGHNGAIPGYGSIAMYLPEADATVVVLVNKSTLEGGAADTLVFDIVGLLFPERLARHQAGAASSTIVSHPRDRC